MAITVKKMPSENAIPPTSPRLIARVSERPVMEVHEMLKTVDGRKKLAAEIGKRTPGRNEKDILQELTEAQENVERTLKSKESFLMSAIKAPFRILRWGWRNTFGKHPIISTVALIAIAAYFGLPYLPSWDQIMSWVQKLRGAGLASTINTGLGSTAQAAAPVTSKLIEGAVIPTTPATSGGLSPLNLLDSLGGTGSAGGTVPPIIN